MMMQQMQGQQPGAGMPMAGMQPGYGFPGMMPQPGMPGMHGQQQMMYGQQPPSKDDGKK
jgi:hypothetical protein